MINLYVSPDGDDNNDGSEQRPWQTLQRSADGVRDSLANQRDQDIAVHLGPGTHRLSSTVVLGPEHSPDNDHNVTFRGTDDGSTVVSSGVAISEWTHVSEAPADVPDDIKGAVWLTVLPAGTTVTTLYGATGPIPRARGSAIQPQPLGLEGDPNAPLNYGPNGEAGFRGTYSHRSFAFPPGAIAPATDLNEAECLIIPKMQWTMNILPVASVDFDRSVVELGEDCTYPIGIPHNAPDGSIWLENTLSVLTRGSWVYHAEMGTLFYCPEGDEPEEGLEAGSLTEFIRFEGEFDPKGSQNLARNIHLESITFTHSNRFSFHGLTGLGIQHDWEMYDAASSMVRLRHAEGCSVANCTFEHGGSGGVRLDLYCQGNRIADNTFRYLGMCGVLLCGYGPSRNYVNRSNAVVGNHIHNVGESYWHCPAIFIWQSGDNHIADNHIHDTPYTGIVCSGRILYERNGVQECSRTINWDDLEEQCGEGYVYNIWWYSGLTDWWKREPLLHSRENLIEYNHIHDVMQIMGDGNGIYVSGGGGGNIVRFNAVGPCPSPTMSEGIRCDDDQHHTIIHGNLIFAQGGRATGITLKGVNRVTNNVIALPLTKPFRGLLSLETGPLNGSVVKHNIFLTAEADETILGEIRIHGTGRTARLADTDSDSNIYYCIEDPESTRDLLDQIQSFGTDYDSAVVDPGFEDAAGGDFRLRPNSAATAMGIRGLPLERMFSAGVGD